MNKLNLKYIEPPKVEKIVQNLLRKKKMQKKKKIQKIKIRKEKILIVLKEKI